MNDLLTAVLAEVNRKNWAALPPIHPSSFDQTFLGNALEVEPGQSLMHYMQLDRFKSLIANHAIYMRRLDLFQLDPHEGRFPAANTSKQSSLTQGLAGQLGFSADA